MDYKKAMLLYVLMLGVGLFTGSAQQSLNASGGNAAGSGGSSQYAIGQMFNPVMSSPVPIQQSLEFVPADTEDNAQEISLSVYPNPTMHDLVLNFNSNDQEIDTETLRYRLYDPHGNLLMNERITGDKTEIKTRFLAPSFYYLNIMNNDKSIHTFKIIKY